MQLRQDDELDCINLEVSEIADKDIQLENIP